MSHERSGIRLQDSYACFVPFGAARDTLVGFVSDGAGSASHGGQGASLICRTLAVLSRVHVTTHEEMPDDALVFEWLDTTRDRIRTVAERRGLTPRDFAGTLVGVLSTGEQTLILHVGDGCAVVRDPSGQWTAPLWPDHGEYASTTSFLTDDPAPNLRLARVGSPIRALALFSDGLERLALQLHEQVPFQPFFTGMIRPLEASAAVGRDQPLSAALKRYLNSDAVNARTDDDKSLVLAVRA